MNSSHAPRLNGKDLSQSVIRCDGANQAVCLGGKARALSTLTAAGFPVPPGVVLTPDAFYRSLTASQRRALVTATSPEDVSAALATVRLLPDIELELTRELLTLVGNGRRFAVRSSAEEEDSAEHSFAGQLNSYLFVTLSDVADRVADVWRSGFSSRVFTYRRERNLTGLPPAPAVLIQLMIDADVAGVAFSADPVSGERDIVVVGSLYGLGTALVSGEADADTHRVDGREKVISRQLATKSYEHEFSASAREGIAVVPVAVGRATEWALSDQDVIAVARLARRAELLFGRPQDVEWALCDGQLHLLQSRPITSLAPAALPDGVLNIWDNSNIAESYAGVTTPLTFSFARYAYEGVYRQLCRIFGVPETRIEDCRPALENMIGLVRGRVYYNVLNWYRLLVQCPGYRYNASFFEQMIGLRESIPDHVLGRDRRISAGARLVDGLYLLRSSLFILANFFVLNRKVRLFHERVDAALEDRPDLSSLPADALVGEYRLLASRLLTRWDAPLINDFFAMIFYGELRRRCVQWCGDESGTLQNDLLCAAGGMVSSEPDRRLARMAQLVASDGKFVDVLRHGRMDEILTAMDRRGEFRQHYESYLARFGERCSEELKLETPTLHDDPLVLFRAVGSLACQGRGSRTTGGAQGTLRVDAEARVKRSLTFSPVRRAMFNWILGNARATICNRENLRLERTRVFGRVRRIFLELGQRLCEAAALEDARDILYLRVSEAIGFVEGTAVSTDLIGLTAMRRAEYAEYAREDSLPDRFETRGIVNHGLRFVEQTRRVDVSTGNTRQGIGCCPGKVTGQVRVVVDPRTVELRQGDILVAERTDPGWIMLFPFASGLLVERGNLLSHSAIVARELGIPTIVAIDGVTRWLRDGDTVEFDGATGVVRKSSPTGTDR